MIEVTAMKRAHEDAMTSVMVADSDYPYQMQLEELLRASTEDTPGNSAGLLGDNPGTSSGWTGGTPTHQSVVPPSPVEMAEKPLTNIYATGDADDQGVFDDNQTYDLYFATVRDRASGYTGIAWALTNAAGSTLVEQASCLGQGGCRTKAHYLALIEGLEYALSAKMKNIVAYGNSRAVCRQFSGEPSERMPILKCIDQVKLIQQRLNSLEIQIARTDDKVYMSDLARRAVESHLQKLSTDEEMTDLNQECPICCDRKPKADIFVSGNCAHYVCRDCLLQYVEVQIKGNQVPLRCPKGCGERLELDQCRPYLSTAIIELFEKSLAEASIPESERIYCPFPNCSALMMNDGMTASIVGGAFSSQNALPTSSECMECHRLFCAKCHVPWHSGMSCAQYQWLPPEERDREGTELFRLVKDNKWQRCRNCQNVIELNRGCNHMTCRCGYEFCYTCGAKWTEAGATCKCEFWEEDNIISDSDDELEPHHFEDESEDEDEYNNYGEEESEAGEESESDDEN